TRAAARSGHHAGPGGACLAAPGTRPRHPELLTVSDRHDVTFRCMGGDVRLLVEGDDRAGADVDVDVRGLAAAARGYLLDFDERLSRFRPQSELCALNADGRSTVPASPLLRAWARAATWAAHRTKGLVDPTLVSELERAGYRTSQAGHAPIDLTAALVAAPPRRPAQASRGARWRAVGVDDAARTITRPPGLLLDTGGTGKGLAADSAAGFLSGAARYAVDCAGDIAIGGTAGAPYEVQIEHPLTREVTHTAGVVRGGIATSGIDRHLWRTADGGVAHHLLNPETGRPAWTGLISVTVVAASVLEAETLAKAALLSGPDGARRVLWGHTGVLVHDDGDVEVLDAADRRARLAARELVEAGR
ncbi:MAG: FAD:protein transferase, partial [Solirubrobacterales bacterium]|nr:FAD:protein transferase [Solirubrobacterales bacterium]